MHDIVDYSRITDNEQLQHDLVFYALLWMILVTLCRWLALLWMEMKKPVTCSCGQRTVLEQPHQWNCPVLYTVMEHIRSTSPQMTVKTIQRWLVNSSWWNVAIALQSSAFSHRIMSSDVCRLWRECIVKWQLQIGSHGFYCKAIRVSTVSMVSLKMKLERCFLLGGLNLCWA